MHVTNKILHMSNMNTNFFFIPKIKLLIFFVPLLMRQENKNSGDYKQNKIIKIKKSENKEFDIMPNSELSHPHIFLAI